MAESGIASDGQASSERARSLEVKYIELLEQKIKDLEATLEKDPKLKQRSSGRQGKPNSKDDPANPKSLSTGGHIRFRERIMNHNDIEDERDCEPDEMQSLGLELGGEIGRLAHTTKAPTHELTWMKIVDDKGQYMRSEFIVEAAELKVLLSVVLSHYPNLHFWPNNSSSSDDISGEPVAFYSPFVPLLHNWESLKALWPRTTNESGTDTTDEHVPEVAEIKSRIQKAGSRTDFESQHVWPLLFMDKNNNFWKAREQLKRLMSAVSQAREMTRYFSTLDVHRKAKTVQFDFLWTIFPPGELIFSKVFMDEPQVFLVKHCSNQQVLEDDQGYVVENLEKATKVVWRMEAWAYDWNGRTFQRAPIRFEFDQFAGSRPISTLHCYPLSFYEGSGELGIGNDSSPAKISSILLERGRRFKELCTKPSGFQMFDYHGDAIAHGSGFPTKQERNGASFYDLFRPQRQRRLAGRDNLLRPAKVQHVRGRIMVDFQAYIRTALPTRIPNPMGTADFLEKGDECKCASCTSNFALRNSQKVHWDGATADTDFDDLQYIICPPRVLGYHLESKTWLELNVGKRVNEEVDDGQTAQKGERYLEDVAQPIRREAFQKLQLTKTHKMLIQDLVESHTSGAKSKHLMDDIMEGKGRGLVILLHGPPGVGKTLTAESVAQLAGKPLFSVGVSDIGTNPGEVEQNFQMLFELAANWRAVLLFDEADVFLESRSSDTSDLKRNALVSVLLRVLEYYDGILILTTNRIREFDIAVQSRVNLGIKYEDLDREQKQEIFDNFMSQLHEHQVDDRKAIKEWFKDDDEAREWVKPLNGRQIRNILFSAASLAVKEKGVLKLEHVKKMTKSTAMFHDTVKTIIEDGRRKAEAGRL